MLIKPRMMNSSRLLKLLQLSRKLRLLQNCQDWKMSMLSRMSKAKEIVKSLLKLSILLKKMLRNCWQARRGVRNIVVKKSKYFLTVPVGRCKIYENKRHVCRNVERCSQSEARTDCLSERKQERQHFPCTQSVKGWRMSRAKYVAATNMAVLLQARADKLG